MNLNTINEKVRSDKNVNNMFSHGLKQSNQIKVFECVHLSLFIAKEFNELK